MIGVATYDKNHTENIDSRKIEITITIHHYPSLVNCSLCNKLLDSTTQILT